MASGLSLHRHLLCVQSPKSNDLSYKFQTFIRNPNCSGRLKIVPRSSPPERSSASLESESPARVPKSAASRVPLDPGGPPASSLSHSSPSLLRRLRDGLKFDELGLEMLSIALPAALALAADPIASLFDTAFVGHLGSVELAAVGVSVSVFNLVSKLFNVPLLNITTSFVAEEQALVSKPAEDSSQIDSDGMGEHKGKKLLPSVSSSLALAAGIGIAEAVALSLGSGFLMNVMGIPVDSPMRVPAEHFLTLRAFGAPPIVIALAAQGTFRGFMDTKTPLYAIGAGNLLNVLLGPILIFLFGLGIGGAAIATVISEYLIAFILLWKLNKQILLIGPHIDGSKVVSYLKSGGLLIGRTLAVLATMTLATSLAAREGPIPMAGHQICIQVWLAVSLLTDALALAGQFVAGSQPMNAIAFVVDGLYYGVSDFGYAAYSMVLVGLISSVFLLVAASVFGLPGVWMGLFLFMTLRVGAGIWRLGSKSGPWKMVLAEMKKGTD